MKISAVIPAYNAARYVAEALESVLLQSYSVHEIIVVDDGSTDDTAAIVGKWVERDPRIKLVRQTNAGVSAARNCGIQRSTGDWIGFLDADDTWQTDHLEVVADVQRSGNCDMVVSGCDEFRGSREVVVSRHACDPEEIRTFPKSLLKRNFIAINGVVISKELLERTGGFDPGIRRGEDWHLWLRALAAGGKICFSGRTTSFYRRHEQNVSGNQAKMLLETATWLEALEKDVPWFRNRMREATSFHYRRAANLIMHTDRKLAGRCLRKAIEHNPKDMKSVLAWALFVTHATWLYQALSHAVLRVKSALAKSETI